MSFTNLETIEKLNELIAESKEKPVVLFKHSLTCSISANIYHEVADVDAEINLIIVQNARHISNEIAARTNIRHESPQAIVLKDEKPVYYASHYDITAEDLKRHL
jgi:bacillithiol system protein YtxJ